METEKKSHHKKIPRLYGPWRNGGPDDFEYEEDADEEDSWVKYLRRNLEHQAGTDSPFPESEWSYASGGSLFDHPEKKVPHSDEDIRKEVQDELYKFELVDASHIEILVVNGVVSLEGSVDSQNNIGVVQKLVEKIPGVWNVQNHLKAETIQKRSLMQ